ncbi:MAG: DUF4388 domain-containing protein [Acidobacteria bacterium]|nr:DUF4388 domain-containing protein [Acidobacteriota bacterium]
MSISGSLEDVSVADVMQFIHLGRRTGTLVLASGADRGMIGFHKGRLVSARGPSTPKLGDMLVASGVLDPSALETAVQEQQASEEPMSLGQVLIAEGKLEEEALRQVVSEQIEKTIGELVQWDSGSFEFAVDDLRPIDEIALFPGDLVPGTDMNTQMVLLEAARIFDERNRHGEPVEDGGDSTADDTHPILETEADDSDASWAAVGRAIEGAVESGVGTAAGGDVQPPTTGRHVVHLVSADDGFAQALEAALPQEVDHLERLGLDAAGHRREGYLQPVVLVDLREGQANLGDIAVLHDRNPGASIVALVDRVVPVSQVYGAGALAALPAEVEAAVACVVNVMQSQQQLARIEASHPGARAASRPRGSGVARLRRVFGDLRSGLLSATVALNLMHIISESVERAVLFLVRHDCLQALGAFGMGTAGRPLAELTRGLRLDLDEPSILIESLNSGEAQAVDFDEAELPAMLRKVLQRPLTGQVVVFPVLGAQRVISIIYTDNGDVNRPIEDIEILELATAQVGMAFENELLRRKISQHDL